MKINDIIIGQEVVCPHGLGRVTKVLHNDGSPVIRIKTYVEDMGLDWNPKNVKLVPITTGELITIETED